MFIDREETIMSLYDGWQAMMQDTETPEFAEFWNTYIATEKEAYRKILSDTAVIFSGKASELAETFGMDERIFAGFLYGINDSLTERIDVPSVEADTEITLSIDFEKLYYNMHAAKADWLYNLKEWNGVLTEEKRKEITKQYRLAGQYINNGPKVGPNDPCPCGSGKKYKKCCGRTQD